MDADGLAVTDLSLQRGRRLLFERVSFTVARGAALLLRGANGVGKSSLLRALVGLTPVEDGRIRWAGQTFAPGSGRLREAALYLGHAAGLKAELTAYENLALLAELDGSGRDPDRLRAALAAVELSAQAALPVQRLSQGQKQRLSLARLALAEHRPLWLLDEPSAALDSAGVALLDRSLGRHLDRGGLAIIATHLPVLADRQPTVLTLEHPAGTGAVAR